MSTDADDRAVPCRRGGRREPEGRREQTDSDARHIRSQVASSHYAPAVQKEAEAILQRLKITSEQTEQNRTGQNNGRQAEVRLRMKLDRKTVQYSTV